MSYLNVQIIQGKQLLDVVDKVKCRVSEKISILLIFIFPNSVFVIQVRLVNSRRKGDAQISSYTEASTNPIWEDAVFDL